MAMSTVPIIVRQVSDLMASHIEELERKLKEQNERRLIAEGNLEELTLAAADLRRAQRSRFSDRSNEELECAANLDSVLRRLAQAK